MLLAEMPLSQGALYALLSILMVFAVLLIIIGITTLIFKLLGLFELKKTLDANKKKAELVADTDNSNEKNKDITDEDMMVAVLIATIDYQNEMHQDVRLISVKEVK